MVEYSNKHQVNLSRNPIDINEAYQFLQIPTAGGIAIFVGTTRKWTDEQETVSLTYESYEAMALKEMHALLDIATDRWPIHRACLFHRLGNVPLTEASVLVGVATPHRPEAFQACRFLIDQLKIQVPIWKQEHLADGRINWVEGTNSPDTDTSTPGK